MKERNGKGKEFENDKLIFEGEYLDDERNGKGKEYYFNGKLLFEGEYSNDKKNGEGKEYYLSGKLFFEGEYVDNKKWDGKGYDENNNNIYELIDGNAIIKEFDNFGKIK